MTITSAGKTFNLAGLRCAVAHFGAESVLARRDAEHPNRYGAVSVAALVGTLAARQQGHDWQDTLIRVLDRNRHHVHDAQVMPCRRPGITCRKAATSAGSTFPRSALTIRQVRSANTGR